MEPGQIVIDPETVEIAGDENYLFADVARLVATTVGFQGEIRIDNTPGPLPPRTVLEPRLLFDMNWKPHVPLDEGLRRTYEYFLTKLISC